MLEFLIGYQDLSLLFLRIALGTIFLVHGIGKLKHLPKTWEGFESMGFRPGKFWGSLVAVVEAVGGLLVFLGWYMQWGALGIAVVMLVALLWKMKNGQKLVNGYEIDLILLAAALYLATLSVGGAYSLDWYFL